MLLSDAPPAALVDDADLAPFFEAGPVPVVVNAHALRAAWREALERQRTDPSPTHADRLAMLTRARFDPPLTLGSLAEDDQKEMRVDLEAALDAFDDPGRRAAVAALIACSAWDAGDHAGADAWLARAAPAPDHERSEVAWAPACATLDTSHERWGSVRRGLEAIDTEDLETTDLVRLALLRANAIERQGDTAGAVDVLRATLRRTRTPGGWARAHFKMHVHPLHVARFGAGQVLPVRATGVADEVAPDFE